jgi:hypothetical protein
MLGIVGIDALVITYMGILLHTIRKLGTLKIV